MNKILLAVCFAAPWLLGCGASLGPRPKTPPAVEEPGARAARAAPEVLENGLAVTAAAPRADRFAAALLFPAGPLDDPPELPGLTEVLVEAAIHGSRGDPDEDRRPQRRALLHGGEVIAVADGRVAGWIVVGPRESAGPLLEVLEDVARRPSFPASRVRVAATLVREHLESTGNAPVGRAVALAAGLSLGLGRPLDLGPTPRMLDALHREDLVRHRRQVIRPERGVLVLSGGGDEARRAARRRLRSWQADPPPDVAPPTPCVPQGHSAHLVLSPDTPPGRAVGLLAGPAIGGGSRAGVEAILAWLGRRPLGPVAELVGSDEARRAAPERIDVGTWRGEPMAIWLGGIGGARDDVLAQLDGLGDLLARTARQPVADDGEAAEAVQMARGRRLTGDRAPLRRLVVVATKTLFEEPRPARPTASHLRDVARRVLAPHHHTYVVVGAPQLERRLAELAPVSVWDLGGNLLRGPGPPRCLPVSPGDSASFWVDTSAPHR